jgi:hypothetical protein
MVGDAGGHLPHIRREKLLGLRDLSILEARRGDLDLWLDPDLHTSPIGRRELVGPIDGCVGDSSVGRLGLGRWKRLAGVGFSGFEAANETAVRILQPPVGTIAPIRRG